MFDIKGKNCIVTGGATGIGLGYVKELLRHGANVSQYNLPGLLCQPRQICAFEGHGEG